MIEFACEMFASNLNVLSNAGKLDIMNVVLCQDFLTKLAF